MPPAATATATPVVTATPWVQASPPPGVPTPAATPQPVQTPAPTPKPKPPKSPKPLPSPTLTPSPSPTPSVSPSLPEEVKREMMRRRAEEQRAEAARAAEQREAARLDQLPPDERAAYQRNLPLWRQLPTEERQDIRRQADERARQEIDKAYQESGLTLDHDQREVFDLRYRQERRRLERELQDKINAERTRRLTEISEGLKREFAGRSVPAPASSLTATPTPKKTPPADPAAMPSPEFKR